MKQCTLHIRRIEQGFSFSLTDVVTRDAIMSYQRKVTGQKPDDISAFLYTIAGQEAGKRGYDITAIVPPAEAK